MLRACIAGTLWYASSASAQVTTDGLRLEVVYTADLAANISGGVRRDVVYLDNVDVTLSVDGAALGWGDGTTLFLYGLGNQGGSITELVGDAQGTSNIEAPTSWRLYEAWIEKLLFSHRLSALVGLYDVSSEFDVIHNAAMFIHGSPGTGPDFSQSGTNGPSIFPFTSLGGRVRLSLSDRFIVKAAVLDGVPGNPDKPRGTHVVLDHEDGLLFVGEAVALVGGVVRMERRTAARRLVARNADIPDYDARVAIGGWTYTTALPEIVDPRRPGPAPLSNDSRGAYIFGEWNAMREPTDRHQGLSVFARAGVANDRVNRFGSYVGFGAVYTGLIADRDSDHLGVSIAIANNGGPYESALGSVTRLTSNEAAIEATYLAHVTDWLALQASLQYVINPNTDADIDNALVPILRVQIAP